MKNDLPNMENVEVHITRAIESSGNQQFFVRARRIDTTDGSVFNLSATLEYNCFQTAYNGHIQSEQKCIEHACFAASYLLKFFGKSADDLKLNNFTEEHLAIFEDAKDWLR